MRVAIVVAVACLAAASLCAGQDVKASITKSTNIPAQDLVPALKTLARERGFQVVFRSEVVGTKHTQGAVGYFTTAEALAKLLKGTNLVYSYLDEKTVTISLGESSNELDGQGPSTRNVPICSARSSTRMDSAMGPTSGCVDSYRMRSQMYASALSSPEEGSVLNGGGETGSNETSSNIDSTPAAGLEEVVVTAERRTVNLQNTNLAASSLGAVDLAKHSITEITNLQSATPSLSIIDQGQSKSVNIRGIGMAVASPAVSPGIATYRDGVFLPTLTTLGFPFYDLQDVEVLRGPQGTFAAQDATGGAVFVNSKSPTFSDHPSGDIAVAYGNYNDVLLQGAANLPLSDTLAARVAFLDETRKSFYNNISPTANGSQPGKLDTKNLRIGLLWKPTDALSVLFKTEYDRFSNDSYADQPLQGTSFYNSAPKAPFVINFDQQGLRNDEDYALESLQINYTFENGPTLKSNTGYQYHGDKAFYDVDASPVAFETLAQSSYEHIWTEDLSLVSPDTGPLRWVIGGTFFSDASSLGVTDSVPLSGAIVQYSISSPKRSYGIFGSTTYNILPTLELQTGVRYSGDLAGQSGIVTFATPSGIPLGSIDAGSADYKDHAWTGKVALNWKVGVDDLLYAFWAKGYKAGGLNGFGIPDFAPETVYDYETGWKSTKLDGHLRIQLDGFYMQYKNFQANEFAPALQGAAVANAGATSTIKGFEAQTQLQLGAFGADANLSYVHSNIGSLPNQVDPRNLPNGSATGLGGQCTAPAAPDPTPCFDYTPYFQSVTNGPNIYSPKWSANVGVEYEFNLGSAGTLTPRGDVSYMGEQWGTFFEAPVDKFSARTLVNLHLTYQRDDWTVQLYSTNLANRIYMSGYSQNIGNNFYLMPPRQFGLRVTRKF